MPDLQIGAPHFWIAADLVDRAGGDDAPVDENGDTVGKCEDRIHVVLDQEDRRFVAQLIEEARQ
jgi:hypothetical protein